MTERSIIERMEAAIQRLEKQWRGRRWPKAFYLTPDDWDAFMATNPPTASFLWGNNPATWRDDPTFKKVPVRQTSAFVSRLYNNTSGGTVI